MYDILNNLFTKKIVTMEERERCALFFGHDYGWKNYMWASQHLLLNSSSDEQEIGYIKERVDTRYKELLELRQSGFASTGTLLSEEADKNMFMVAYLES